jgi:prepilin-type N-terminal cleavage/methylation domain-containing protein
MSAATRQSRAAFTLIEALIASVILAIATAAAVMPFTCGAKSQDVEGRQCLAVSLAKDLMEEILRRPFVEPGDTAPEPMARFGPDAGETLRSNYSAIDDYNGYTEQAGQIVDPAGQVITDAAATGLSRQVTISYVYVTGQNVTAPPSFMSVTVEVRYNGLPAVTLTRLVHWIP